MTEMKILTDEKSNNLYHYTTKETLIEFILPLLNLKLNFLKNTNDPKEKTISTKHAIQNVEFAGEYLELSNELQKLIDTKYRVCCFATDYINDNEKYYGYQLQRMWATYGDNHKGICLVIDRQKFIKENSIDNVNSFLEKIDYDSQASNQIFKETSETSENYEEEASKLLNHNLDKIFYTKHHDWITEHEVRLVSNSDNELCSIKESLSTIILGFDFNLKYKPSIIEQLKATNTKNDVNVMKINFNHKTGDFEIK
jgi:hypothetical protein